MCSESGTALGVHHSGWQDTPDCFMNSPSLFYLTGLRNKSLSWLQMLCGFTRVFPTERPYCCRCNISMSCQPHPCTVVHVLRHAQRSEPRRRSPTPWTFTANTSRMWPRPQPWLSAYLVDPLQHWKWRLLFSRSVYERGESILSAFWIRCTAFKMPCKAPDWLNIHICLIPRSSSLSVSFCFFIKPVLPYLIPGSS